MEAGKISDATLAEFLERQRRLRAALLAGASLASEGDAGGGTES